jgi:asparagine synthase (glutamine-hydrolysing)
MTALAGLWRFDGRPDAAESCARMLVVQELYGPHHGAQWSDSAVALGRRLMRVLPEDAFDRQPLIGGEERYVLVADVRLDNRDELTEALRVSATQARSLCDAAILLAAIERWGESCFEHLVGDYAFAVWDRVRHRLLLARDPLGLRPLHYHRGQKFFAFASMPKGLHALPEVPYAPDEERIAEFLVMMPENGAQSFFLGIERVEPGHVVIVTANGLATRRHWQPSSRRITLPRPKEHSEALRALLDQAVSCRLRATGDVGAHLSGGLDSAAVAATAARLLAPSGRRVIAFTCVPRDGYDSPAPRNSIIDEGPGAAATAAFYPNIEHVVVRNEGRSPLADLDRTFFLLDGPPRNLCPAGWAHSLDKAVRERKLKVFLSGGLGNLGLSYDGLELLPELFHSGRWLRLWREASALVAARRMRWRGVLASTFGPWCPPALWLWIYKIAKGRAFEICDYTAINRRRLDELGLKARAKARNHDLAFRPFKDGLALRLHLLQCGDSGNAAKANLAHTQVDSRHPLADVRLLEFCFAVPMEQFLRDGMPRALARSALADRLPKRVLEHTSRPVLQVADWHEDLTAARDGVVDELDRLEACPAAAAALDLPRLRRLTENWPSGGWERDEVLVPYRYTLLSAIAVGHFLRRATGSNR